MDKISNPFAPGAGTPPPKLVGRGEIIEQAHVTLARIKRHLPEKGMLLIGLRGTGKTVLLNKITMLAEEEGYTAAMIEAHEKKSLAEVLLPELRRILIALDAKKMSAKVKKAFGVLKSFISSVKVNLKINELDFEIGIEAEKGAADSGNLEADLVQVFIALGEAAQDQNTAIAIIIDELQYINEEELSALIMALHKISQKSLPFVIIGAGLPQLVGQAGRAKSYSERLFDYPEIGPLSKADAIFALQTPVEKQHVSFTQGALDEIIRITEGYPYFLQEWGYHAWNIAEKSPIDIDVIKQATTLATQKLDQGFFRVRFDRLTPREKEYLRALAELGNMPQRSGDIATLLNIDVQTAAPIRNSLIKKGMIYSPAHGDTAFTVPLFDKFMKRIIPQFP